MTKHENTPSSTSGTLPSQTNDQLSELVKECLAKIKEYKSGPWLPLKKVQCITKITELLLETCITPHLTESKINTSLLSYTDIINAVDAAIWQAEWVRYCGRTLEQVEEELVRVGPRDRSVTPNEGQTSKRQKVDIDTFPWVQRERISATLLNTSLMATLALLKLYTQDLKLMKVSILTSPRTPQFPTWNGRVSSQEQWSILTMSFQGCMLSPTITEKLSSSEEYSSSTEWLKQPRRSETWETGCKCFGFTQRQSPLFLPTERKNLRIMQSRLPLSLQLSLRPTIPSLSTTIRLSEPTLETCGTSSSLTSLSLRISDSTGFTHSDRDSEIQTLGAHLITVRGQATGPTTTVSDSMMGNAPTRPPAANTDIGVQAVEVSTQRRTVIREEAELQAQWPHYTHGFL